MNIYLIGMMGSGKSVTGKVLAERRKMRFVDFDAELERRLNRTIADIFEKEGESFFRAQEKIVLTDFSHQDNQIVSTGGGAILDPENTEKMRASGKVVYLETSFEWLWERVKNRDHRPLLKGADPKTSLERILSRRLGLYESAADLKVNTDGKTAEKVALEIEKLL